MKTKPMLGIMTIHAPGTPPFPEKSFYKQIVQTGQSEGIPVIIFHPNAIDEQTQTVKGYTLNQAGSWISVTTSLPTFIYDRCFYIGKGLNKRYRPYVLKLKENKNTQFLGLGLKGKWQLYQMVLAHPVLSQFLPHTDILSRNKQINDWLNRYKSIILKPINGSLGMGIIKITEKSGRAYDIEGRDLLNKSFRSSVPDFSSLSRFIHPFIRKWKYLIQPYLTLISKQGVPFDLRIFMQKDGTGQWISIGKAVRIGQKNSITSNLHGGGKACCFKEFLDRNYSREQIEAILSRIKVLEEILPPYIEGQHGQLVELGIDAGIDQDGRVWLLEVNSKPGRQIFEQINDQEALKKSQVNPVYYALHLMQTRSRRI